MLCLLGTNLTSFPIDVRRGGDIMSSGGAESELEDCLVCASADADLEEEDLARPASAYGLKNLVIFENDACIVSIRSRNVHVVRSNRAIAIGRCCQDVRGPSAQTRTERDARVALCQPDLYGPPTSASEGS